MAITLDAGARSGVGAPHPETRKDRTLIGQSEPLPLLVHQSLDGHPPPSYHQRPATAPPRYCRVAQSIALFPRLEQLCAEMLIS